MRRQLQKASRWWLWLLVFMLAWGGVGHAAPATATKQATVSVQQSLPLENSPKALVDEAWQVVSREFIDPQFNKLDWQQVRSDLLARDYDDSEAAYTAIREILKKLGDQYTRFLTPDEYQRLVEQTSGQWVGVGLRLMLDEDLGKFSINFVFPNSPAAEAGLQTGDQLVAIEEQSVKGLKMEEVTRRIRGEVGTAVRLTFVRKGSETLNVALKRSELELPVVTSALRLEGNRRIGYLRLSDFSARAASELRQAMNKLADAQGWILDLRGNLGGRVDAATAVTGLWLERGPIALVADRRGVRDTLKVNGSGADTRPLVVLVDGSSASASEIVAGALQDNRRARLVGARTLGKGVIQQMNALADGSGLNVTIAGYRTPSGREIHKKGIVPDVVVRIKEGLRQKLVSSGSLGTSEDLQYQRAVEVLSEQIRD